MRVERALLILRIPIEIEEPHANMPSICARIEGGSGVDKFLSAIVLVAQQGKIAVPAFGNRKVRASWDLDR